MLEMGTSGLMSGDGKRGGVLRQYPRPSSTLPVDSRGPTTRWLAQALNHPSVGKSICTLGFELVSLELCNLIRFPGD